ncbi:MAG: S9 family peptidase [Gammaproteobacteria bacterium]|nr:S9 family peptidase [Gammaproteobacteria bacterium]
MAFLAWSCSSKPSGSPMPKKIPTKLEIHGDTRVDNYFWLNDRDDPAVIGYLEKENTHTDEVMAPLSGLQQQLFREMKSRIKEDEESAPYKRGDYYYYYRFQKGNEYPIYARRKGSLDAAEQILLDVNALAGGHDYFAVRSFSVSPDHALAVFGVDTTGRRFYTIYFLDLETGQYIEPAIADVTNDFEWANDSRTLFYTKQDRETLRWHQVYRHRVEERHDELVYEESDERFWLSLSKSLSGDYIFLTSDQTLSNEVRYVPSGRPEQPPRVFLQREDEHEYFVTDGRDRFYVLSNENAANFRLLETPLADTSKASWREVVPHREDVLIEDFEVHQDYVALDVVENGLSEIELLRRDDRDIRRIDFDEAVYTASVEDNYEYDSEWIRYYYESLTTPESVYDFNPATGEHRLIREDPVLGGFDRNNYRAERLFAPARDGTPIPVSLVYRKGMKKDGSHPLYQYGYGSYGYSIEPDFDAHLLSLLDRGFVFAIAHVRGGSEMGRQWYYDGRQLTKKNTFYDFIDVTRFLLDEGYSSAGHVYARGGSAGGLLMGAVANMAPELYNGISTRVPFVDVITTMLDASIPLTTGEWDEWGNPADKEYYDYILSYSPYDNVVAQDYPNMLVTTGLHDSQVQYWEPAKWVAKLRELKTDDNVLLLKTDMQAGHGGKTGRFRSIEDTALYYAFYLGLENIFE